MEQKFFRIAFAASGDRQTIPDNAPSSGAVSFPSGWGADYAKDPAVDANAKPVEREAMNEILHAITNAVRQYQVFGFPEWITPANNGGAAFRYSSGAVVRYSSSAALAFKSYVSIADNNTVTPGTDAAKWQEFIYRESSEEEAIDGTDSHTLITPRRLHDGASYLDKQLKTALTPYLLPIGAIIMWPSETPPDGWLELNGQQFDVVENPKLAVMFPSGVLPDYRGRIPRGWDHGAGIDTDSARAINSLQEDALQRITGSFPVANRWRGSFSGAFRTIENWNTNYKDGYGDDWGKQVEFDSAMATRSADETRPKNIAVMFIIKTDLAESENSAPTTPTALIISPQTVTVNAGTTRQFNSTVLPAALAAGFTVSWAVSDQNLGSINSAGLYTATAGMSGAQTIIASLSTGLTATATVTQYIYLTSISVGNIQNDLIVDNSYDIAITYYPGNYTEPVIASSSDSNVASLSVDGTLSINDAGTATLILTGANSGVTDTVTITATRELIPETRLLINNNLSEIAAAGATAQATARNNLGLGALATKGSLTAAEVDAVPQSNASLGTENLNTVVALGRKFQSLTSNATVARNYPIALAGMLDVIKTTGTGIRQVFYPYNNTDVYHRYCVDVGENPIAFSAWSKSGGDYLDKSQNLADVPNKSIARDNIGVGYTISTSEPPASASGYAQGHIWYQV